MEARVMFATSAMHAYAHQWECQLVFSPRMQDGLGLTDGEGVERLWSRLRRLIGLLRNVSVSECTRRSPLGIDNWEAAAPLNHT